MASKGPRTFGGMVNKMVTGDGRKKPSSILNDLMGTKKKKKYVNLFRCLKTEKDRINYSPLSKIPFF
jgi:hypothetical protein